MKLFGVLLPLLVLAAMVLTPRADDNSMARRLGLHRRLRGGLSEAARLKLTRSRWAVPPAPPPSAFTSSDPGEVTIIITTSEDPKQRSGDKAPSVPHHRAAYANSTPDSDYASAITAAAGFVKDGTSTASRDPNEKPHQFDPLLWIPEAGKPNLCPRVTPPTQWTNREPPAFHASDSSKLASRLTSIASTAALATEYSAHVRVFWPVNSACPVKYEDLFSSPVLDITDNEPSITCSAWDVIQSCAGLCRGLNTLTGNNFSSPSTSCARGDLGVSTPITSIADANTSVCLHIKASKSVVETGATAGAAPRKMDNIKHFPAWGLGWWYRQLKPSKEVAERMDEVKNLLGWDEFVWVGVHVMNPSLVFEVPHPKPRMPAQQLSIRVIAPPSSYMYEMMKLQKRMMAASSTSKIQTQIRFLIIGDSAEAVNELVSEARPAFEEWQLVKWVEVNRNLTFGTNDKEGLFGAAVDMFLLSETRHIIHAVQSGFSNMAALVGGQNTTRLGEYQGRRDAMPMDL